MKKLTRITLLCFLAATTISYGQFSNEINKNFLRNYKAPDFKQKRFDILLFGEGRSSAPPFADPTYRYSNLSSLSYSQYSNTQRYQGFLTTGLSNTITGSNTAGENVFYLRSQLDISTQNYFYVRPNFFIGAHGAVYYQYRMNRIDKSFDYERNNVFGSTAISAGFGRLEPVQYARNAMDIQRSLMKGGRIKKFYSVEELTILSDEIARINNVRFYDFRLRRIDQFEALDKTMERLGHVSDFDMTYFAYLADAYLYAQSFARFSGFRHEFGLAETVDWLHQRDQFTGITASTSALTSLFYRGSMHIPASYTVQHEIEVLATISYDYYPNMPVFPGELGAYASSRYTLGFYPTTRTNFNVGAEGGARMSSSRGYSAGVFANATFYISPQFRISGFLRGSYTDGYTNNPFTGIWNDYGPSFISGYAISGNITLNYAIF